MAAGGHRAVTRRGASLANRQAAWLSGWLPPAHVGDRRRAPEPAGDRGALRRHLVLLQLRRAAAREVGLRLVLGRDRGRERARLERRRRARRGPPLARLPRARARRDRDADL